MKHKPKCVIVTGASRGIGRACCDELAKLGVNSVSLSRCLPENLPDSETHYKLDLSDLEDTVRQLRQILKQHPVDAVICNAGRGDIGSLENFSPRQIQESIAFNLISPISIVRECLPYLRSRARSNVVFIGSTSALHGNRYGSLYSAAKFGLRGAAQALSHEVAGACCHVGIVHPGSVRSSFFERLDFEPGPGQAHALEPIDVADAVIQMLGSPDQAVVSELTVQPRQHVVKKSRPGNEPK